MVKILSSDMDSLRFERAQTESIRGDVWPVAVVSGVRCNIETKPGPLRDGLAYCAPLDPFVAVNWPISVRVRLENGTEDVLPNMTTDSGILRAARRWAELLASGDVRGGIDLLV